MQKEEQVLFPMMKTNGCPMLAPPISRMRMEHETHGEHLRLLRELAHNFEVPEHACASWRALYAGVEKLTADLMEHIHIENNLLFPRFDGSRHYGVTN
jgi:regulator of cell morphogenesis and NO signaling